MKKKLSTILLGVALMVTSLSGCGDLKQTENALNEDATEIFEMPTEEEKSSIYVEAIDGISDDFIRGVDVSSVMVEENSGVVYYGEDGTEQDIFKTLAQAGVNYVRLRVWNDPYDEYGNGYGGGNNDVPTAIELGKRATEYGMSVCIDFHYSDFWADPKRQHAPKAWEDMNVNEKCDALYEFTKESLSQMLDEGIDVNMVQVGNEINNAMAGEDFQPNINKLLRAGCKAVREIAEEYDRDIKIVIHYTRIDTLNEVVNLVSGLEAGKIDYDIVGLSFYPFWDGTIENMQSVANTIQEKTGKQVMIAETSYAYTSEDGDGCANSFVGTDDVVDGYPATVQGQANMIRDICAAANEANMLGVFYWEPAWIPVGPADEDNSAIWEKYGSGWASSYASDYDPEDAGLYYGGCSWDNQAMFDFEGHPLASLNVWKYLKYGAYTDKAVDFIDEVSVAVDAGDEIVLPEKVKVYYNDSSIVEESVTWNQEDLNLIDTLNGGEFDVTGELSDGTETVAHVTVTMFNYLQNPGFEDEDTFMWNVSYDGDDNPTDYQNNPDDAYTGDIAFHWFDAESEMSFSIEQTLSDLEEGTYQFSLYAQGGDVDDTALAEVYVIVDGNERSESFMVTTWCDWQNPVITDIDIEEGQSVIVGVRAKMNAGSWGTIDDVSLNRISD